LFEGIPKELSQFFNQTQDLFMTNFVSEQIIFLKIVVLYDKKRK